MSCVQQERVHYHISSAMDSDMGESSQDLTTLQEYEMVCESGNMSWTVWLRYSEILDVANRVRPRPTAVTGD